MTAGIPTIWITGLSAAGKTTLSERLVSDLASKGIKNVELLDGELLRAKLDRPYDHSLVDRFAVLDRIVEMAQEAKVRGDISIVATISHKRVMREIASQRLSPFMEICLQCPVDVCASRDSKGVYSRAG